MCIRDRFGSGFGATVGAFVAGGLVYLVGVRQYAGPLKVAGLHRMFLPAKDPCATPSGAGTTVSEERATGSEVG